MLSKQNVLWDRRICDNVVVSLENVDETAADVSTAVIFCSFAQAEEVFLFFLGDILTRRSDLVIVLLISGDSANWSCWLRFWLSCRSSC